MQTSGSGGFTASEREAELRRRNEEIDARQSEALRVAQDVVRLQQAKLVLSPGGKRSPSRQDYSSAGSSPARRSASSAGVRSSAASGRFLDNDDEGGMRREYGYGESRDGDGEEIPSWRRGSPQSGRVTSPQQPRAASAGARRGLQMDRDAGTGAATGGGVTPQMGAEATIRYLKAKLKVVEEELEETASEAREAKDKLSAAEKHAHDLEQASAKSGSIQSNLKVKADKLKSDLEEKSKLVESLQRQLSLSQKEKDSVERTARQTENATGAKDVRLNRALEEVERYKKMLSESKVTHAEQLEQSRKQLDKVMLEKKKLAKQKGELLNGFKKQMKLIDVLRRQLVHVQAAKMLSLTEEEFTRALELGETI